MKKEIILVIVLIGIFFVPTLVYGSNQTNLNTPESQNQTKPVVDTLLNQTKDIDEELAKPNLNKTEEPITKPLEYTEIPDTGIWKELSENVKNIYYGKVLSKKSYWVNSSIDTKIYTDVEVEVLNTTKGNYKRFENVTITLPGGTVGNIRLNVFINPYGEMTCQVGEVIKVYENEKAAKNKIKLSIIRHVESNSQTNEPMMIMSSSSCGLDHVYEGQGLGFGYEKGKFSTYPVNYYIDPNCPNATISTNDNEIAEIKGAARTWGNVDASDFSLNYMTTATGSVSSDPINTIFWGETENPNAIGECYTWQNILTGYLTGFDIVLNEDVDWSYNGTGQGVYDIKAITTHELGHVLSLKDLYGTESYAMTMYGYVTSGMRSLERGDILGITYLYGTDEDVPSISFNSPSNNTLFQHHIFVSVDVTCNDGIDTVECRLGYKIRDTKNNPDDVYFEPWTTLTHQAGDIYTGTVYVSSQSLDPGNYWITVRANSSATPSMYGYQDRTLEHGGWLTGYDYCKQIDIYGSTYDDQTDYQIPLRIVRSIGTDTDETDGPIKRRVIYVSTHCESDFDDLRFRGNDGETVLPYWIEEISGSSAYVWVKIDSIPEAPDTTKIYMYYGNSGASKASDGLSTFENRFYDFEFDTAGQAVQGWNRISSSAYDTLKASSTSPKQGSLCALLHEYASDSVHGSFVSNSYTGLSGYVAHYYFKEVTNGRRSIGGLKDSALRTVTAVLCRDDVNDWRRTKPIGWATLTGWTSPTAGTWYRIEIFRDPNTGLVKYYQDRANGVGWVSPRYSYTAVKLWLRGRYQQPTDAYYDVIYVRKYANAEPYANDTSCEIEWT